MPIKINKPLGMTPLELIEDYKNKNNIKEKMSFAGRLDPMAHGIMILLRGDECKSQDKYCGRDKIYRFELLNKIKTDTLDILGIVKNINTKKNKKNFTDFTGKFKQEYPQYSSIRVKGKPLWWWTKKNLIDTIEIPNKEVEVYDKKFINEINQTSKQILETIKYKNSLLSEKSKRNFRYNEIIEKWEEKLNNEDKIYTISKYEMKVSSGTYIRKICEELGGIAFDIERIDIL